MNPEDGAPAAYEREKLYEEVWAEPVRTVAARYGVSDVALAKTCRRLDVPLPGRGYWAKLRAGNAPARPALPPLPVGKSRTIAAAARGSAAGIPFAAPKERGGTRPAKIVVPETLKRPHPLVTETRDLLKGPGPRNDFVFVGDKTCLDIFVSRGARSRALRIMDALLKALEGHGHRLDIVPPKTVTPHWGEARTEPAVTRVKVGEEWIHFGLSEAHTWVKVHRPLAWAAEWGGYSIDRVRKPTGRFSLHITNSPRGFRATWNDGKKQRVEDCLADFVAYLPVVAERLRERRIEGERRAAIAREKARLHEEAEGRRLAEEQRTKELIARLERWRLARDIRAYVAEATLRGVVCAPESELALRYADEVDPLGGLPMDAESETQPGAGG